MKIAITGAAGHVGRVVVEHALEQGHVVVGIDQDAGPGARRASDSYTFTRADLRVYAEVVRALAGCDGVAHLAALRTPGDGRDATHNNNVVLSWNVLRAAAELGITRVAQASSINVVGLYWNQTIQLDYLPLDEAHPCRPDDPYSLSKQICEAQADALVRRFPSLRIASLRLHMVVPTRAHALGASPTGARRQLWGYTLEQSCASAFLLALTAERARWTAGHEPFFVVEREVGSVEDVDVLLAREKGWEDVERRGDVSGRAGLFDCTKAERLLGWRSE